MLPRCRSADSAEPTIGRQDKPATPSVQTLPNGGFPGKRAAAARAATSHRSTGAASPIETMAAMAQRKVQATRLIGV